MATGPLGNINNASTQVNEDKKSKTNNARVQSPFIEATTERNDKNVITNKSTVDDITRNLVINSNANKPSTTVINKATTTETLDEQVVREGGFVGFDFDDDITRTDEVINKNTVSNLAQDFFESINSTPNKFADFASVTYSVSLYLLGKAQYAKMVSTGTKSVNGLTLMLQSGGISSNSAGNHGARRSSTYFKKDFYIDDITLQGLVSGTSTGSAHNTFELQFTITEPNGLTFLEELHGAVQEYNVREGVAKERINYAAQHFLMVVRFYGYDKNGKQITGRDIGVSESFSDLSAVSEKYIPFMFKGISFAIENDVVKYRCEAVCPQTQIPLGVGNSTIPFNVELVGQNVKEFLSGYEAVVNESETNDDQTTEELEAQDAELEKQYQVSLVEALNNEQKLLVRKKVYDHANVYKIEFEKDSGIDLASVLNTSEFVDKTKTAMGETQQKQQSLLTSKGFYNNKTKKFNVQAGTSIVQAIDMIIRTSTYISDQQNIVFDEKTGKVSKKEDAPKILQWFKIRTQVIPLEYDLKRNDFAYEIKYVISRYQINNLRSQYFGPPVFRGVHKEFNYWFTGQNTEVLDFRQDYNYLYFQTMGADLGSAQLTNNARELTKRYYQRNSTESRQGGSNRLTEAGANAASILYSPADQAQAKLTIVGDPDWIAQSEIFYTPDAVGVGLGPFMSDGSINYDSSEVLFAVNYNTPLDYDLNTGIADVGQNNVGRDLGSGKPGSSQLSLIYRANTITTNLSNGAFTQQLEGTLMLFPLESQVETEKQEVNDIIDKTIIENPVADDMVYDYEFGEWMFKQELDEDSVYDEDVGVESTNDD